MKNNLGKFFILKSEKSWLHSLRKRIVSKAQFLNIFFNFTLCFIIIIENCIKMTFVLVFPHNHPSASTTATSRRNSVWLRKHIWAALPIKLSMFLN